MGHWLWPMTHWPISISDPHRRTGLVFQTNFLCRLWTDFLDISPYGGAMLATEVVLSEFLQCSCKKLGGRNHILGNFFGHRVMFLRCRYSVMRRNFNNYKNSDVHCTKLDRGGTYNKGEPLSSETTLRLTNICYNSVCIIDTSQILVPNWGFGGRPI